MYDREVSELVGKAVVKSSKGRMFLIYTFILRCVN